MDKDGTLDPSDLGFRADFTGNGRPGFDMQDWQQSLGEAYEMASGSALPSSQAEINEFLQQQAPDWLSGKASPNDTLTVFILAKILLDDVKTWQQTHKKNLDKIKKLEDTPKKTRVYVGVVEHKHGFNHYAQPTKEKLWADIRKNFCDDYKDEIVDPERYDQAKTDEDKVSAYFEDHESEFLTWDCMDMEL